MVEMRIGFTIFRVKRPRSIDEDAFSWDVPRRVEKSTTRRKTTDSVREIERVFFCGLELAVILRAGRSFDGRNTIHPPFLSLPCCIRCGRTGPSEIRKIVKKPAIIDYIFDQMARLEVIGSALSLEGACVRQSP
jgi:hypothetical protein